MAAVMNAQADEREARMERERERSKSSSGSRPASKHPMKPKKFPGDWKKDPGKYVEWVQRNLRG